MSSVPSDWSVTYSDSGDNSIQIASFADQNDWGDYNLAFTTVIGGGYEPRTLTLSFAVYQSQVCPLEIGPYEPTDASK